MKHHTLKATLVCSGALLLTACGAEDDKPHNISINEDSYAVQLVASDYSSAQIAVGNLEGDRTATQAILSTSKSDYDIASYGSTLYHIGRNNIDTISRYDAESSLKRSVWSYSTNDANSQDSANPYTLVQNADDNAYLIRYGATTIWQVDPSATQEANFLKATIDLSAYNVTGDNASTTPRMAGAVIENNTLFVILQRLDSFWAPQTPYLVAIDMTTNQEIDTNPQQGGLKGIPLNAKNALTIEAHNGSIYVSGRGNYGSDSGALDKIDATTYAVTNLIDGTTFTSLNNADTNTYYHVTDVAPVNDQLAYAVVTLETGYTPNSSLVYPINLQNQTIGTALTLSEQTGKVVSEIAVGPNNRLWMGVRDGKSGKILVVDTDTNTQNGETIELDMPVNHIVFLDIED